MLYNLYYTGDYMAFENLKKNVDNEIEISGFVEELRLLGNLAFIILRRREGTLQVIAKKKEFSNFDDLNKITIESVVNVKGIVKLSEQARNGFEILLKELVIETKSDALPIDISGKIESDLSTRFDNRFLDLRQRKNMNIFILRSKIIGYVNEYFQKENFIAVNTPKITTIGAESGASLFKIDYMGKIAYLSQSPQVYKQMLQSAGFEKIYELGAVFRAEKSRTSRHLTEFTGLDAELSFVKDLSDITNVAENMFKYIIKQLQNNDFELLKEMNIIFNVSEKFPIIKFYDALELLEKNYNKKIYDDDLDPEAEAILGKHFLENYKSDFVFVIDYPISCRPFYHNYNSDNKTTNSFDLLYKGQEITTGAIREHKLDLFLKQAEAKGLDLEQLKEYSKLLKYGCPSHGGFGMGLDRIVGRMTDLENTKEAVLFPRDPDRLLP